MLLNIVTNKYTKLYVKEYNLFFKSTFICINI